MVISGQRKWSCLFFFMPIHIPHIFYNGSMPYYILKNKSYENKERANAYKTCPAASVSILVQLWADSSPVIDPPKGSLGLTHWHQRNGFQVPWEQSGEFEGSISQSKVHLKNKSREIIWGQWIVLGNWAVVWITPSIAVCVQTPPPRGLGQVSFPQEPFLRGSLTCCQGRNNSYLPTSVPSY